jgi:hypothetical protein
MGFGSYDESEQEQPGENDAEDLGEDVTGEFHRAEHEGNDSVEDSSTEAMFKHL